jgi:hypothetical protein
MRVYWVAMTHGSFLSVAAAFAILAAVAVLSSAVLRMDGLPERRGGAVLGVPSGDVAAGRRRRGGDTVDLVGG